jgi:hypothetical protein
MQLIVWLALYRGMLCCGSCQGCTPSGLRAACPSLGPRSPYPRRSSVLVPCGRLGLVPVPLGSTGAPHTHTQWLALFCGGYFAAYCHALRTSFSSSRRSSSTFSLSASMPLYFLLPEVMASSSSCLAFARVAASACQRDHWSTPPPTQHIVCSWHVPQVGGSISSP